MTAPYSNAKRWVERGSKKKNSRDGDVSGTCPAAASITVATAVTGFVGGWSAGKWKKHEVRNCPPPQTFRGILPHWTRMRVLWEFHCLVLGFGIPLGLGWGYEWREKKIQEIHCWIGLALSSVCPSPLLSQSACYHILFRVLRRCPKYSLQGF